MEHSQWHTRVWSVVSNCFAHHHWGSGCPILACAKTMGKSRWHLKVQGNRIFTSYCEMITVLRPTKYWKQWITSRVVFSLKATVTVKALVIQSQYASVFTFFVQDDKMSSKAHLSNWGKGFILLYAGNAGSLGCSQCGIWGEDRLFRLAQVSSTFTSSAFQPCK